MPKLEDIYPAGKRNVIDLVKEAGVDVSDWKNFKGGARKASTNPKYCYEWSFIEPGEVVVLNLWYVDMTVTGRDIVHIKNTREFANAKGRKGIWKKRALKMDHAFQYACSNKLPIRVIVCDGKKIKGDNTSTVTKRSLDSEVWAVTEYNANTGDCLIKRGAKPKRLISQTLTEYLPVAEEKICKICWNDNGWQYPSGSFGKSKDKDSYENIFHYGHEEWIFDFDKLIDGYHYAFFQPVSKSRNSYIGNSYSMDLYSVKSTRQSEYFWITHAKNIEVIDCELEEKIIEIYKDKGWLDEMVKDLGDCGANVKQFKSEVKKNSLFNVRFRPKDIEWFGPEPVPFSDEDSVTNTRYRLIDKKGHIDPVRKPGKLQLSGKTKKDKHSGGRSGSRKSITQCRQLHTDIQNGLCDYLIKKYPKYTVDIETGSGMGTNIDVVLIKGNNKEVKSEKLIFFEVKTYPSAKMSIREALGQLLEYAYYPNRVMAKGLVIVTHSTITKHDELFLDFLNTKLSIPIGFMQFDHKACKSIYTYNCKV